MPVLRSPFSATVSEHAPLRLDATASGATFTLFISSITASRLRGGNRNTNGEPMAAYTTVYVTVGASPPIAIGSVDANSLDTARIRVKLDVRRGQPLVTITARGPDAVTIVGDQHTIMSREQVDAVGSKVVEKRR
jgi:hypothetical protein